jgi:Arc/MetJ-type ribon-helix-helix transcriptional regulator
MNINLGAPYEAAIREIILKGYAGNQTEAIRQAILAYKRMIEEEELNLVHKAVEIEMLELDAGKAKTHSLQDIKTIVVLRR